MKTKNKTQYFIILFILIFIIIGIVFFLNKKETSNDVSLKNENIEENNNIKEIEPEGNNLSEQEKAQIEELKNNSGITGDTQLYEVQKDYNDTEIAIVKPSIKYKVAFSGMIKKQKPEIAELDSIVLENHPKNAGIWVEDDSRTKFLELINNNTDSVYEINEKGYLRIKNKDTQNESDKKLEKIINGNILYIFSVSSTCYIVDDVTGEILDYCFESLDKYQTYEYFSDEDKCIVFVTENKNKLLSETEIFESLLNLISE